jgi:hypothetical protein
MSHLGEFWTLENRNEKSGKTKIEELKMAAVRIGISWGENSEREFELRETTNITTPPPAVARDPAEPGC